MINNRTKNRRKLHNISTKMNSANWAIHQQQHHQLAQRTIQKSLVECMYASNLLTAIQCWAYIEEVRIKTLIFLDQHQPTCIYDTKQLRFLHSRRERGSSRSKSSIPDQDVFLRRMRQHNTMSLTPPTTPKAKNISPQYSVEWNEGATRASIKYIGHTHIEFVLRSIWYTLYGLCPLLFTLCILVPGRICRFYGSQLVF